MRHLFILFCLSHLITKAQQKFVMVEQEHRKFLSEQHKAYKDTIDKIFRKYKKDTVKVFEAIDKFDSRSSNSDYKKSEALFSSLVNTPIPNIVFVDYSGKQRDIGEFKDKKTIINFNNTSQYFNAFYIDSLLNYKKANVSIVVLYSEKDVYSEEISKKYEGKITLGYITKAEEKMYTLSCGTPSFLFIEENNNYKDFLYLTKIKITNSLIKKISEF